MPVILDACDKYFGTRDVYELFKLHKDSQEKESEWICISSQLLSTTIP